MSPGPLPPLIPEPTEDDYFPLDQVHNEQRSRLDLSWYADHLIAMREPPLLRLTAHGEQAIRFLWDPSFHRPVSIRVVRSQAGVDLTAAVLRRGRSRLLKTGLKFDSGTLVGYRTKHLTQGDWMAVQEALTRAHYESLPPWLDHSGGRDGAQWLIESANHGRYQVVERWSPDDPDFCAVGELLVSMAGGDLGFDRLY